MFLLEIQTRDIIELEDNEGNIVREEWFDWKVIKTGSNKQELKDYIVAHNLNNVRIRRPDGSVMNPDSIKVQNPPKKIKKSHIEREMHPTNLNLMPVERKGRGRIILGQIRRMMEE